MVAFFDCMVDCCWLRHNRQFYLIDVVRLDLVNRRLTLFFIFDYDQVEPSDFNKVLSIDDGCM